MKWPSLEILEVRKHCKGRAQTEAQKEIASASELGMMMVNVEPT